jgi:3-hydroxybutyryl-CoA dehydratase
MSTVQSDLQVKVGETVSFTKTVSESDIYLFAGITGDLAPVHVNEAYMKESAYGRRIAHGVLMIGFMSTTSSIIVKDKEEASPGEVPVSLGYDRIRFLKPVYIGDTVTVTYRVAETDPERKRSRSQVNVTNQNGDLVCTAQHILKWVQK